MKSSSQEAHHKLVKHQVDTSNSRIPGRLSIKRSLRSVRWSSDGQVERK